MYRGLEEWKYHERTNQLLSANAGFGEKAF
jgi:hypothetical protein